MIQMHVYVNKGKWISVALYWMGQTHTNLLENRE